VSELLTALGTHFQFEFTDAADVPAVAREGVVQDLVEPATVAGSISLVIDAPTWSPDRRLRTIGVVAIRPVTAGVQR
jgi:hypothetical protein